MRATTGLGRTLKVNAATALLSLGLYHASFIPEGLAWTRVGEQDAIDVSADGWDSDMIEYPCVFEHGGRRYLLYSGNGYGREGFGIAVWEA